MPESLKFDCLVTDEGLKKIREVTLHPGWKIEPTIYKLASTHGEFTEERTYDTMEPAWYSSILSGAYPVDEGKYGQIIFSVVIPPNAEILDTKIEEIYFICKDRNGEEFLYGIAQPNQDLYFTPGVTQSYAFVFTINNINVPNTYVMNYTFPQDIEDHNHDPLAHDEILTRVLNKSQVSNCILESPNGVIDYNINSITVKNGLKHLIPDGRLANGALKNIELIQENDVITNINDPKDGDFFLFTTDLGKAVYYYCKDFYIQEDNPNIVGLWYSHKLNLYNKINSDKSLTKLNLTLIGVGTFLNQKIKNITVYNCLELIKRSDLKLFTATPLAFYQAIKVNANTNINCQVDGIFYSSTGSLPTLSATINQNGTNHSLTLYSYTFNIQKGMIFKSSTNGYIIPYIGQD